MNMDYIAGLFDGEGWYTINRAKASRYRGKREWAYQCSANITLRERYILEDIHKIFGGTLNSVKPRSENHSPYFAWRVGGLEARRFAVEMRDKSLMKFPQADLIVKFQDRKNMQGNRPLEDETYNFYGWCFDRMKLLNQKGVGKNGYTH